MLSNVGICTIFRPDNHNDHIHRKIFIYNKSDIYIMNFIFSKEFMTFLKVIVITLNSTIMAWIYYPKLTLPQIYILEYFITCAHSPF